VLDDRVQLCDEIEEVRLVTRSPKNDEEKKDEVKEENGKKRTETKEKENSTNTKANYLTAPVIPTAAQGRIHPQRTTSNNDNTSH
jgi:hypothetical protein